jgi:hypothetical protein
LENAPAHRRTLRAVIVLIAAIVMLALIDQKTVFDDTSGSDSSGSIRIRPPSAALTHL